jgi:hypothetical protein
MKGMEIEAFQKGCWRKIAITLIIPRDRGFERNRLITTIDPEVAIPSRRSGVTLLATMPQVSQFPANSLLLGEKSEFQRLGTCSECSTIG